MERDPGNEEDAERDTVISLYLIVLFIWVSRFKLWIAFGLALGIGVGSWLFFGRLLSVQLPQGPLPF